jgi:hypothetical protein
LIRQIFDCLYVEIHFKFQKLEAIRQKGGQVELEGQRGSRKLIKENDF